MTSRGKCAVCGTLEDGVMWHSRADGWRCQQHLPPKMRELGRILNDRPNRHQRRFEATKKRGRR